MSYLVQMAGLTLHNFLSAATGIALAVALARAFRLGPVSLAGIALVAALLAYEHSLVKPDDFSRVNAAFFTVNGCVSVLFFAFWAADMLLGA